MTANPTLGKEWRKQREEGFIIELPSGHVARIRPYPIDAVLSEDGVPNELKAVVAKMFNAGLRAANADNINIAETIPLINYVCTRCFIEPRIVANPEADDEIAILDVSLEDRMAVFERVMRGVQELKSFRQDEEAALPGVGSDQDLPQGGQ